MQTALAESVFFEIKKQHSMQCFGFRVEESRSQRSSDDANVSAEVAMSWLG